MGSDMSGTHLRNIIQQLIAFESKPKEIKGAQITDWFSAGERVFEEFYNLGTSIRWDFAAIKDKSEVSDVIARVTRNQEWLESFVSIYPSLRIDLDGSFPAVNVCKVRSGLESLLRGFVNIKSPFNKVIKDIEELGELDELDRVLRVWVESGHRPEFFPDDRHPSTPQSHWWWH